MQHLRLCRGYRGLHAFEVSTLQGLSPSLLTFLGLLHTDFTPLPTWLSPHPGSELFLGKTVFETGPSTPCSFQKRGLISEFTLRCSVLNWGVWKWLKQRCDLRLLVRGQFIWVSLNHHNRTALFFPVIPIRLCLYTSLFWWNTRATSFTILTSCGAIQHQARSDCAAVLSSLSFPWAFFILQSRNIIALRPHLSHFCPASGSHHPSVCLNTIDCSSDPDRWTGTVFGICDCLSWQTPVCSKFLFAVACVELSFLTFLLSLLMVLEIELRARHTR